MPLQRCQANGSRGWKWGNRGKCYTGEGAKARASKQARAIRASGYTDNARRRVRTRVVASNPLKADPTRSATLRRMFETEFTKRFAALKGKILRLVVDEDAFGLRRNLTLFNTESSKNLRGNSLTSPIVDFDYNYGMTVNQRWAFQSSPQKVQAFQNWLATQVQADIITTTAENVERAYWQRYVEEGYRKGAGRAFDDTRKVALQDQGAVSDFYQGTKDEFLRSSFARPVAIEKVQLLAGRVYTDLKGVTEAMAAGMSRTLADGLVQGKNPREIARDLNKVVDGIGKRRAQLIARTEIIRAHAEGQLDAFERLGVDKLGVMAEWSTAGDDRVCELCESLEGVVLDIKEARGILPRHPQCVVGETKIVAPDSLSVMSAEYTGKVFEFTTALNCRLTTTSHHILLTQRGWMFAKDITDTDYLINASLAYSNSVTPDNNLAYPTISQVFRALVEAVDERGTTQTLAMPEYLHGDGQFVDSEIKIVDTQGVLGYQSQTTLGAEIIKRFLMPRNVTAIYSFQLRRNGAATLMLERLGDAADRLMSSLGITDILQARAVLHHQPVGRSVVPNSNLAIQEVRSNAPPAYAEPLAKGVLAGACQVEFDKLVSQHFVPIKRIGSRHVSSLLVYDVSTNSTLYAIAGVLTSNCRCAYIPANVGESGAGQKRSKAEIQESINDSLRAEMPKRTKRTLAEQKRRSKWPGADKKIAKVRPKSIVPEAPGFKPKRRVDPKPAPKPTAIPKVKADKRKLGAGEKVEGVAGPNVPVVSRTAMLPSGIKTKLADPTKLTLLDDGKSIYHYTPSRNLKAISKEGLGSGKAKRAALGREADEGADFLYGLKSTDPTMFDEGLGMDLTPEAFNQEWAVLRIKPKGGRKLWQVDPEFADDFGEIQAIRRKMVVSPKEIEVLGDKGWQPLSSVPKPKIIAPPTPTPTPTPTLTKPITPKTVVKTAKPGVISARKIDEGVYEYEELYHGSSRKGLTELRLDKSQRTKFGAQPAISSSGHEKLSEMFTKGELGLDAPGEIIRVQGPFKVLDLSSKAGRKSWDDLGRDTSKLLDKGYDGVRFRHLEEGRLGFYPNVKPSDVKDAYEVQLFRDVKKVEFRKVTPTKPIRVVSKPSLSIEEERELLRRKVAKRAAAKAKREGITTPKRVIPERAKVKRGSKGRGLVQTDKEGFTSYAGIDERSWGDWAYYSHDIDLAQQGKLVAGGITEQGEPLTEAVLKDLKRLGSKIQDAAEGNAVTQKVLYRGESYQNEKAFRAVHEVTKKGTAVPKLTSTGTEEAIAADYYASSASDPVKVLIRYHNAEGVQGIQTSPLGVPSNEVVLPRGAVYKTKKIAQRKDGVYVVDKYSTESHGLIPIDSSSPGPKAVAPKIDANRG